MCPFDGFSKELIGAAKLGFYFGSRKENFVKGGGKLGGRWTMDLDFS
jgi:hypothetical protein